MEEEVKQVEETVVDLITEGGYRYITKEEDGHVLKIRNSVISRRLVEDDETFAEYKIRQRMAKAFEKQQKQGVLIWPSKRVLAQDTKNILSKLKLVDPIAYKKEVEAHYKLNMGTYDEKKLAAYIEKLNNVKDDQSK